MKPNIGGVDRIVRMVAGLALLGADFWFRSWWGLLGLVPLLTAILRFCPAYLPLGVRTCRREK